MSVCLRASVPFGSPDEYKQYETLQAEVRRELLKAEGEVKHYRYRERFLAKLKQMCGDANITGSVFAQDGKWYMRPEDDAHELSQLYYPQDFWLLCFDENEKEVIGDEDLYDMVYETTIAQAKERLDSRMERYGAAYHPAAYHEFLRWLSPLPDAGILTCDFAEYAWACLKEELHQMTPVANLLASLEECVMNGSSSEGSVWQRIGESADAAQELYEIVMDHLRVADDELGLLLMDEELHRAARGLLGCRKSMQEAVTMFLGDWAGRHGIKAVEELAKD